MRWKRGALLLAPRGALLLAPGRRNLRQTPFPRIQEMKQNVVKQQRKQEREPQPSPQQAEKFALLWEELMQQRAIS